MNRVLARLAPLAALSSIGAWHLCLPGAARAQPEGFFPETALSTGAARSLARVEGSLARSPAFRRLAAAARRVPRKETRRSALPEAFDAREGAAPELVLDRARWDALGDDDAAVLVARGTALAGHAAPLPLVESAEAAWQAALLVLVEVAAEDEAFSRRLARAVEEAGPAAGEPRPHLPSRPLARAALLLRLFEADPLRFHEAAGRSAPLGAARLSELEDLVELRGAELAALGRPPSGPSATLGGRRYPAALVRAALALRGTGRLERLRESLGAYETVGVESLRGALVRWRRGARP